MGSQQIMLAVFLFGGSMKVFYAILAFLFICMSVCSGKRAKDWNIECHVNNCYLCGNCEESIMDIYGKRKSVGIVHVNTMSILETHVRSFNDSGKELYEQGEDNRIHFVVLGGEYGTVITMPNADRGYSEVSIFVTDEDAIELEDISEKLCLDCIQQITKFYEVQQENSRPEWKGTTGYCLIDFETRKLYSLTDVYSEQKFGDYIVKIDKEEDGDENESKYMELLIVYAPIRKKKLWN